MTVKRATFEPTSERELSRDPRREGVGLYNLDTGMEYIVYVTPYAVYVEAWHENVGQVSWYLSFDSYDTVEQTLLEEGISC